MDPNAQNQPAAMPAEGQVISPQPQVAQPEPQVVAPPLPPQPEQPVVAPQLQPVAPPDPLVAPQQEPAMAPPAPVPTPAPAPAAPMPMAAPTDPAQPMAMPAAPVPAAAPAPVDPATVNPGKSLGVVSLILSLFPGLAIVALILGIVAKSKSKKAGMPNKYALIGIILSIVNIVAVTALIVMMSGGSST